MVTCRTRWSRRAVLAGCMIACITARFADAATYTWTSPTTGGAWSTAGNWSPATATAPTTADTAVLDTVTANTTRTVTYDASASGIMTTLTMNQTASGTNTLQAARGFQVSSTAAPVTLGAGGDGLTRIFLDPQTNSTNVTGTFSGGLKLNAGGLLSLGAFNPAATTTNFNTTVNGSVLVSGGSMVLEPYVRNGTNTGSQGSNFTSSLTMTSGTITINNASPGSGGSLNDRRLTVSGSFGVTGGSVVAGSSLVGGFYLNGTANTYQPSSVTNNVNVQLGSSSDQALTTNQVIPTLTARSSGVKTYTSTLAGANFGELIVADENTGTASSRTTFKMASDLTLQSGRNLPSASGLSSVEPTTNRIDVGIDASAYTLNLAANAGVWIPNIAKPVGTGTTTYWWLSGTAGTIIANGFKFDTLGVATSVGPGLVLESRSGNNVANVLSLGSGTGAIDPTSTFRYAGAAAAGTPSTLASSRAIGNLEVTSGALLLSSLAGVQAVRVASGASLDLGGLSLTVTSGSFDGSVSNGTLTSAGGWNLTTGTVSAALAGTSGLSKGGAGLLSLTGANTFNGGVTITGGTVQAGTADAFGPSGTITMAGGGIAYGSGVTTDFSSRFSTAADQTLAVNVGGNAVTLATSLVSGGTSSFTRSGAGLLTLTGPASSIGTQGVVVNGGTTVIDPGAGGTFTDAGRLYVGNQSGASVLQLASGSVSVAPGAGTYSNVADNQSATATLDVTGASATFSLANVRMMVGNKGTGTLRVSSGTLSVTGGNPIYVGGDQQFGTNTAVGAVTVAGGVMQVTGSGLFVLGHSGTSGLNTGAAGTLNLDGGEFRTIRPITRVGGVGTVNFNGGMLTALASSGTFLQGMTAANVVGGAAINTNGFDVTIGQALLGTGTGGLAKSGAGTLRLTGASTYTGATTVSAGRLLVDGSLLGASSVSVLAGTTLGGSGTAAGAVAVLGGTLSPGNSPGVLTVGSLTLDSAATAVMEIAGTTVGTQYDQVVLSGALAYDGGLVLDLSQTFPDNTTFDLFKDFSSVSGNLASVTSVGTAYNGVSFTRAGDVWTSTQSGGQSLQFSQATGDLIVVPEPASLAAAGLAAVGLLAAIRRRR